MRIHRRQVVRQGRDMWIHVAQLLIVVLRQERLQVGPRMETGIQSPKDVLAAAWEGDLVLKCAVLPGIKGEQHTMTPFSADRFGRQEMPEFQWRQGSLGVNPQEHRDPIPLKNPQRRELALKSELRLGLGQTTVQQRDEQGQDDEERFQPPAYHTEHDADQQQAEVVMILC